MYANLSVSAARITLSWREIYNSNAVLTIYRMLMPSEYLTKVTSLSEEDFKDHLRAVHRRLIIPCDDISSVYVEAIIELSERRN
jgi:hypothetical protein